MEVPANLEELADEYGNIMDEVRKRADIIRALQDPTVRAAIPSPGASDLCVLQIRKMCEGIALACLAAHRINDSEKTKRTSEHYRADLIIKSLGKAGLEPFPVSLLLEGKMLKKRENVLTPDAFRTIYRESDTQLHVGWLDSREKQASVFDVPDCLRIAEMLLALIAVHHIQLGNGDRLLVFVPALDENVTVHYLGYNEPTAPSA